MKFLSMILEFCANLIYLIYMTFFRNEEVDFEFLPFGKRNLGESEASEVLLYFP